MYPGTECPGRHGGNRPETPGDAKTTCLGGIHIKYIGMAIVLYVVYGTSVNARRVLSEGNPLGAIAMGMLSALATGLAVYQLFLR